MNAYLFVDTGALRALAVAGLLNQLLPQNNGGRQVVVVAEVYNELTANFPSNQAARTWISQNSGSGDVIQLTTANFTGSDAGEKGIAYYLSGTTSDTDTNGHAFQLSGDSNVLVTHEDPKGMNNFIIPNLPSNSPPPESTTGFLSNQVLSGSLAYSDAVSQWQSAVGNSFLQINDPSRSDPNAINIFGGSAVGNPSSSRQISAATIPVTDATGATIAQLSFPGSASGTITYVNDNFAVRQIKRVNIDTNTPMQIGGDGTVTFVRNDAGYEKRSDGTQVPLPPNKTVINPDGTVDIFRGSVLFRHYSDAGQDSSGAKLYLASSGAISSDADSGVFVAFGDNVDIGVGTQVSDVFSFGNNTIVQGGDGVTVTVNGLAAVVRLGSYVTLADGTSGGIVQTGANSIVDLHGNSTQLTTGSGSTNRVNGLDDVVNTSGSQVIVGGSNSQVTVAGSHNAVTAVVGTSLTDTSTSDVIDVGASSTVRLGGYYNQLSAGDGSTVTFLAGEQRGSVTSTGAVTVNLGGWADAATVGAGSTANVTASAETVSSEGSTVNLGAGLYAYLSGSNNAASLGAGATAYQTGGTGNTFTGSGAFVYGSNAGFTLAGDSNTVGGSYNAVSITGTNGSVAGSYNAVTTGAGISLTDTSTGDVISAGANSTVRLGGYGNQLGAGDGSTVTFLSGEQRGGVTATGAVTVNLGGWADRATLGAGSTANVTASAETVTAQDSTVNLGVGLYAYLYGSGNSGNLGAGATAYQTGGIGNSFSGLGAFVYGSNASFILGGDSNTVGGSYNTVSVTGTNATIAGSYGTITVGTGISLSDASTNDVISAGANSTVRLGGYGNQLSAGDGSTVTFLAGEQRGTVTSTGAVTVSLGGWADKATLGAGSTANVTASAETVSSEGSTVNLGAGLYAYLYGSGNSALLGTGATAYQTGGTSNTFSGSGATVYGSNASFTLGGDGNTVGGSYNTVSVTGTNGQVQGSYNTVSAGSGVTVNLGGSRDVVTLGSGSTAILSGSYETATVAAGTTASVSVTGQQETVKGEAGSVLHVTGDNAFIQADGAKVYLDSPGGTFTISGSSNSVYGSAGNMVHIAGNNTQISMSGGQVFLDGGGSNVSVEGDHNEIVSAYSYNSYQVTGSHTSIHSPYSTASFTGGDYDGDELTGEGNTASSATYYYPPPPGGGGSCEGEDPIVLNLQGGPVSTVGLGGAAAFFDMQDVGRQVLTGWGTPGEGYLVYDADGTGMVTRDADLVGGFSALRSLASASGSTGNQLDASSPLWDKLKVWVDAIGTAEFKPGDLHSLGDLGIASIGLDAFHAARADHGNTVLDEGSFTWKDGSLGSIAGVNLVFDPSAVRV